MYFNELLPTQVAADVLRYDQSQQSKFANLTVQAGALAAQVANHSTDLTILKSNLLLNQAQLRNAEKETTKVHDALAQFRQQVNPRINALSGKGLTQ